MARLASLIAGLVVNPCITDCFLKYVSNDNPVATAPPTTIEPLIKCLTAEALTLPDLDLSSAISLASNVCTATATDSQICVVANPSWNVKLYAAAATDPNNA